MKELVYNFSGKQVRYYLDASFTDLGEIITRDKCIIVTDSHVFGLHGAKFSGYKTIVVPAGEQHKQQATVDSIIQQLIALEADRKSFIIGIGGGVVTDMAGYAASIYMRGVSFGFVPTTILAQVDASIGGKNGVDVGIYKNMAGVIRQPDFILFDYTFLETLPREQWVNGFAEIIKHGCIRDAALFDWLEQHTIDDFRGNRQWLVELIKKNVILKSKVVEQDEFEQGDRKLLNFGHTLGHAIENEYELLHGHAISIGMVAAAAISTAINDFPASEAQRIAHLLRKYGLTVAFDYDKQKVFEVLKMDKKRAGSHINFVLLSAIGKAVVVPVPLEQLEKLIQDIK